MTVRAALIATAATLVLGLGACSDATTEVLAGAESAEDGSTGKSGQPVLQAVLEPANALIGDLGEGWTEVDRWYTEGAMTHWGTGCSGFDRLGDIFNHGTPQTVVWARGEDRLFQRTDDFGWEAGEFAAVVERVPSMCATVEVGPTTVSVTAVDPAILGPATDRITEGDPTGRVVVIAFDAYPHPSPETDIATPDFEPGRPAWMVIATRHNVVSQLVYGPADGSGPERLPEAVTAQVDALLAAPVEATGPFEKAGPPPSVAPGTATDVELFVDPFTCRNDGFVELDGIHWALVEPVPHDWRERNPIVGELAMDGTTAVFTAHPGPPPVPGEVSVDDDTAIGGQSLSLDGFTVALTTGPRSLECISWERPKAVPPTNRIGRLDCDDRPLNEVVVPDEGQAAEDLALEANPQTVRIESDGPLQWSGLDGGGRIVVAVFLGDADNANWQIFTCSPP